MSLTLVKKKLETFKTLSYGWYYGKGGPISYYSCGIAFNFILLLKQIRINSFDVFPNEDGCIQITGYGQNNDIIIIIEPNGNLEISLETINGDIIKRSKYQKLNS